MPVASRIFLSHLRAPDLELSHAAFVMCKCVTASEPTHAEFVVCKRVYCDDCGVSCANCDGVALLAVHEHEHLCDCLSSLHCINICCFFIVLILSVLSFFLLFTAGDLPLDRPLVLSPQ